MLSFRSAIVAIAMVVSGVVSANAAPVLYETTFTANTGPSGTGSFLFDSTTGVLSDFTWDFGGGIVGTWTVAGAELTGGDTVGRYVFEILSEIDVHSGVNCIDGPGFCGWAGDVIGGTAPFGAIIMIVDSTGPGAMYTFLDGAFETLVTGVITIRQARVPEPGAFSLLAFGALAAVAARRRRRRKH